MSAVTGHLKAKALNSVTLLLTVFCCVSGGPYGLEPVIQSMGQGLGLLLIVLTPVLWALPDSLTSCELAAAIPKEGGYVVWVKRALGPFAGFLCAWWTWLYALVDAAIYPVLFTAYLSTLLRTYFGINILEANDGVRYAVGLAVIVLFTVLNIRGTKLVGKTSSVFAVLLIAPFAVMGIIGLVRLISDPRPIVTEFMPPGTSLTTAFSAGLAVVLWNYLGWDTLSTVAEEVDRPERAYPTAMLVGVPLVTMVYLIPTITGLAYFPDATQWEEGAWPLIAEAVAGPWLGVWVNVVGLISPVALFVASLLGSSRVPYVLASDRYLPQFLMDVHPRYGTPWKAILLCAGVYAVLIQRTFQDLVKLNVIMYGSALILETASLLVLRVKEPDLPRPFRIPGGWPMLWLVFLLPVSFILLLIATSIHEEGWASQILTAAALASGPILYALLRRRSSPRP